MKKNALRMAAEEKGETKPDREKGERKAPKIPTSKRVRDRVAKKAKPNSKAPLGQGGRFAALKNKLSDQPGVKNPGALAAYIGRKKYGKSRMASMAAKGR